MVEKTTDLVLHVYLTNNLNIVSFFFLYKQKYHSQLFLLMLWKNLLRMEVNNQALGKHYQCYKNIRHYYPIIAA